MQTKLKYKEAVARLEILKDAKPNSVEAVNLKKLVKAIVNYHKRKLE